LTEKRLFSHPDFPGKNFVMNVVKTRKLSNGIKTDQMMDDQTVRWFYVLIRERMQADSLLLKEFQSYPDMTDSNLFRMVIKSYELSQRDFVMMVYELNLRGIMDMNTRLWDK